MSRTDNVREFWPRCALDLRRFALALEEAHSEELADRIRLAVEMADWYYARQVMEARAAENTEWAAMNPVRAKAVDIARATRTCRICGQPAILGDHRAITVGLGREYAHSDCLKPASAPEPSPEPLPEPTTP